MDSFGLGQIFWGGRFILVHLRKWITEAVFLTASVNKTTASDNLFCEAFLATASIYRKWPPRLTEALTEAVIFSVRLQGLSKAPRLI